MPDEKDWFVGNVKVVFDDPWAPKPHPQAITENTLLPGRKAETIECPCGCGGKAVFHLDAVVSRSDDFTLNLTRGQMAMPDEAEFRRFLGRRMQEFGDMVMSEWRRRQNAG